MERSVFERVAQRDRDEGYDDSVHRGGDQVPSFAMVFELDLMATRGGEGIVVENKTNRFDLSRDHQITR